MLAERYGGETGVDGVASVGGSGAQAPPDLQALLSPETYVGYERQDKFASPEPLGRDQAARYTRPASPRLNEWGFEGRWTVHAEHATSSSTGTRIVFRFHARDLHLVLAPPRDGGAVRFRVSLDGRPPAEHHGVDVDRRGNGVVTEPRLYQLIRQTGVIGDRTFQIEFLDPGVRAYVFTFG